MGYTRAHVRLDTAKQAAEFVKLINSDGSTDKYVLENADGTFRASARSMMGVLYTMTDYSDQTYLVNLDNDGDFPHGIDEYRI